MVDTGVVLGPASGYYCSYGAASNGDGWRVMWADDNDYSVRTSGIGTDGSLFDPQGSLVGHEEYSVSGLTRSIVGTGSGFIAVWIAGYDRTIWAARLDSSGQLLDSFFVYDSDSGQATPAVAFDGDSTCLVVWSENPYGNSDVYGMRVTTGGRVLDPMPIRVATLFSQFEAYPAVAYGQGVYLVAWTSYDTSYTITVKATRVSAGGVVLGPAIFLRHDPAMFQAIPTVTFGDTCFLASWTEGMEQADIYAARVSVSGNVIDTAGIQLCSGPTYEMCSSVGFDGTRYLVMWEEQDTMAYYYALCGRRMTVDGVPLDSGFIRPQLGERSCEYPSVAADDANFLIACTATDTLTYAQCVGCVRISPEGAVLDSGIFFPLGPDAQSGPSGASDGIDFLAAWLDGSGISAARISADGAVLDPVGFTVNGTRGSKSDLTTGFGDSLYLVAWAGYRSTTGSDIYCARVSLDGQVLDTDGIVVCNESLSQVYPDVSFDGQNFLVVWQDYRSMTSGNIYGARVSPSGVVLDPNGFVVAAADTFDDAAPAACFTGTDHLVVWQGYNYNTGTENIYGALVSPDGSVKLPRFPVSRAGYQRMPTVTRGPTNSLVTWEGNDTVYAARVRADGTVLDPNGICVDSTGYYDPRPRVTANAAGHEVLWRHSSYFGDSTYFAVAQIDTAGRVVRKGDWFGLFGYDNGFDPVYGSGPGLLLLFSCYTDTAMGRYYGVYRLWGRLEPAVGIQQTDSRQLRRTTGGATVIRGVLFLPQSLTPNPQSLACLLDISGRKVLDLKPGANEVGQLAPGVYFVRETHAQAQAQAKAVRKVVVTR